MAYESMVCDDIDVDVIESIEAHLTTDEIEQSRERVFRGIAAHWVLEGLQLPESLDVPGVLSCDNSSELPTEMPEDLAVVAFQDYTYKQAEAVADALAALDQKDDEATLIAGAAQALSLEAHKRLGGFVSILDAMDTPSDEVLTLLDYEPHRYAYTVTSLGNHLRGKGVADSDALTEVTTQSTLIARMQIITERDATSDLLAGKPMQTPLPLLPSEKPKGIRGRIRNFFTLEV